MEKLLFTATLIVLMAGIAGATNIESENVTIDIASSEVSADMDINDLTTSFFTYTTVYTIEDLKVEINGEEKKCEINRLRIGSEIKCPTENEENLTVDMEFKASGIKQNRNGVYMFRYSKSFSSPIENFRLKVLLPKGTGILDQKNVSAPVISPSGHKIGSTGRRIVVKWDKKPRLGETIDFQILYEDLSNQIVSVRTILMAVLLLVLISASYLGWRKLKLADLESQYEELSEDEIDLLELLKENEGEILQREAVDQSDYSKAKISEVVSGLEEKGIIGKEKEGRSNKLKIRKNYKY